MFLNIIAEDINEQFGINGVDATASESNPIKIKLNQTGREYTIDNYGKISETIPEEWSIFSQPGLYETGTTTMLKSWEELKSEGLINVTGDYLSSISLTMIGDLVISDEIQHLNSYYKKYEYDEGYVEYEGSALTGVYIPSSVKSIPSQGFYYSTGLNNVILQENQIISVGEYAFSETPWYNNLSDGEIYIGKVCYGYKGTMDENTSITIKDGTTMITGRAFYYCSGLTSVRISSKLTCIYNSTFKGCSSLTSIIIPESVTTIWYTAFEGCSGLTRIIISESVTTIYDAAFEGCSALSYVYYRGSKEQWNTIYISYDNDELTNATIEYDYTGE